MQHPNCKRPAFYIRKTTEDGRKLFYCSAEDGGCGHSWDQLTEDEINKVFDTPTPTRVFSHTGMIDTVMSPIDSIKYHKAFLHAGLLSIEPSTGHIKAWVGGINYKQFQYDQLAKAAAAAEAADEGKTANACVHTGEQCSTDDYVDE